MNKPYDNDVAAKVANVAIYDAVVPALKARPEPYAFIVEQDTGGKAVVDGDHRVWVRVTGPHQGLQPDDIAGCYPADGSDTSPEEFLPHIALTRRTLPWERYFKADDAQTPWMALLLFAESELVKVDGQLVFPRLVSEIKADDPAAYAALKNASYGDSARLDFIRVRTDVLRGVLPLQDELPLLCHVQHLLLDKGETLDDAPDPMWAHDPDCYVAVVMGNRLPNTDRPGDPGRYHACLVSVERRADDPNDLPWPKQHEPAVKPRGTPAPAGKPGVSPTELAIDPGAVTNVESVIGIKPSYDHLVVLQHWSFTPCKGGDFQQVVQEIRYTPNGGVLGFGRVQRPSTGGQITTLTPDGGLQLDRAQGGHVTYYGPLRPGAPPARSRFIALRASHTDDPDDDDSHAAAFEMGRLLALADDGILSDLQDVRLQMVRPIVDPIRETISLPKALQDRLWRPDPPDLAQQISMPDVSGPDIATDPTEVADLVQEEGAHVANVLAQNPAVVQPGGLIDFGVVTGQQLDLVFNRVVTLKRS